MSWFLKGNSRRFFRIDMPVHFYAVPKNPSFMDDSVYCNGINYINQSHEVLSSRLEQQTLIELGAIQEHKATIEKINYNLFEKISLLMAYLKKHSNGESVMSDVSFWFNKKNIFVRDEVIESLKNSSPKTYSVMTGMDEKINSRLKILFDSIEKSSQKGIFASPIPHGFMVDGAIESMRESSKLQKVPIARYFIALYDYIEFNLDVFDQFNNDHLLMNEPHQWPQRMTNISACGMSVQDLRLYEKYQILDIKIYFPEEKMTFNFEGKVINSHYSSETGRNFTAIEFMFPTAKEQLGLLSYIQLYESQKAMELLQNARN